MALKHIEGSMDVQRYPEVSADVVHRTADFHFCR